MIPHYNGHYHKHNLYRHEHNDNDDYNGRTNVISDNDKENSGNNYDRYENLIPGHHCGASEDGSNSPAVVKNYYEDRALDLH